MASTLKSNLHHGLTYTPQEAATRKEVFGDNTYPEKAPKTFFSFVWDAAQDVTLMILMVCALASIVVGIPTEGLAEGWYDGVGILFSIILVVFVTASSDYQQSLQVTPFPPLNPISNRICMSGTNASVGTQGDTFYVKVVKPELVLLPFKLSTGFNCGTVNFCSLLV